MPLRATYSDIVSNARVKDYPSLSVLQVANAPIFREKGYEAAERPYDVPTKGNAKDPEQALISSRQRAKAAIRDIALCNRFSYFFTCTLAPDTVDRYDAAAVEKQVLTFLKNASYRKGFSYVCVPERHRDGAIHLHGLCNLGRVRITRAVNPHTSIPLSTNSGQPIFNMLDWKLGFSTCIPIDERYERTCNYITKYISKSGEKIFGKWYLSSRDLKKHPDISIIPYGMDYDGFVADNPDLPVVPVYRDVCMAICSIPAPEEGGASA